MERAAAAMAVIFSECFFEPCLNFLKSKR